jgi:hypothetical protein
VSHGTGAPSTGGRYRGACRSPRAPSSSRAATGSSGSA